VEPLRRLSNVEYQSWTRTFRYFKALRDTHYPSQCEAFADVWRSNP